MEFVDSWRITIYNCPVNLLNLTSNFLLLLPWQKGWVKRFVKVVSFFKKLFQGCLGRTAQSKLARP